MTPPFGVVSEPWWDDKPVVLVGGGPSLSGFDFRRLAAIDAHVVGANHAMFDVIVEAGISIDKQFIERRQGELTAFARGAPLYLASAPESGLLCLVPDAIWVRRERARGLSLDCRAICGSTTGYAALNLAALKRAKRIVLLGYDYGVAGGRHHWHDGYPWHANLGNVLWREWAARYDDAAPLLRDLGIEVVNASPASAITAFPRTGIEEALTWATGRC